MIQVFQPSSDIGVRQQQAPSGVTPQNAENWNTAYDEAVRQSSAPAGKAVEPPSPVHHSAPAGKTDASHGTSDPAGRAGRGSASDTTASQPAARPDTGRGGTNGKTEHVLSHEPHRGNPTVVMKNSGPQPRTDKTGTKSNTNSEVRNPAGTTPHSRQTQVASGTDAPKPNETSGSLLARTENHARNAEHVTPGHGARLRAQAPGTTDKPADAGLKDIKAGSRTTGALAQATPDHQTSASAPGHAHDKRLVGKCPIPLSPLHAILSQAPMPGVAPPPHATAGHEESIAAVADGMASPTNAEGSGHALPTPDVLGGTAVELASSSQSDILLSTADLAGNGGGSAKITLHPEALGTLVVTVNVTAQGVTNVHLTASNQAGYQALAASTGQLAQHMSQNGLTVGTVQAAISSGSNAQTPGGPGQQQASTAHPGSAASGGGGQFSGSSQGSAGGRQHDNHRSPAGGANFVSGPDMTDETVRAYA